MIKINSRLDNLSVEEISQVITSTILWCQKNIGVNNRRKGNLKLLVGQASLKNYGEFNWNTNTIKVYLYPHKTPGCLIRTLIHEYTHYMQPLRKYYHVMSAYYKYYSRHPMERQAFRMEKHYKTCWEDIRKKINK